MSVKLIAVGVDADGRVWEDHFGIAPAYQLYNREGVLLETRPNPHAPTVENPQPHGKPELIADLLNGCDVWLGRLPGSRKPLMDERGIELSFTMEEGADEALRVFLEDSP